MRYWRQRRRQLRSLAGVGLAEASHLATRECSVRNAIAQKIGKSAAKAIKLILAWEEYYSEPVFVIMSPMGPETWSKLKGIRGLAYPPELQADFIQ